MKNGSRLALIAWGVTVSDSEASPDLQQAEVFAIDNNATICEGKIQDVELQLCAGVYDDNKINPS